jgi:hypothetical protein
VLSWEFPDQVEPVVCDLVPFVAQDFASFAANTNARVGKKSHLDMILHVGMLPLIRALDSFADHIFARGSMDWVAHASRVLVAASRRHELLDMQIFFLSTISFPEKFVLPRRQNQHARRVRYP